MKVIGESYSHIANASHKIVQSILMSDVNIYCFASKLVPKILTLAQKAHHVKLCTDFYQQILNDLTFMSKAVIGDETLVN